MKDSSNSVPAVAYYRASTSKQEASVPEQKEWAGRAAKAAGVRIVAGFEDDGVTGSEVERRHGPQKLLAWVRERFEAGRGVEALVAWDLDRLSRASSVRTAAVVAQLLDA